MGQIDSNKDSAGQEIFTGVMIGGGIGMAKVGAKFGGLPYAASYLPTDGMMAKAAAKGGATGENLIAETEFAKDAMQSLKLGVRNSLKSFYKSPKAVGIKYGSAFLTGGVYGGAIDYLAHHKDAEGDHPMWASAAAGGLVGAKVGTLAYGIFGDAMMNEAKGAIGDGFQDPAISKHLAKRADAFDARSDVSAETKAMYREQQGALSEGFGELGKAMKNTSIEQFGKNYMTAMSKGGAIDDISAGMSETAVGKTMRGLGKGYGYAYRRFNKLGKAGVSTGVLAAAGAGIGMLHHKLSGGKIKGDAD